MNNREYFNSRAALWDQEVQHDEEKIRQILGLLQIRPGSHILDVGTGTGVLIPFLRAEVGAAGKVIAVDVAEQMIAIARGKWSFPNVEFIAGDLMTVSLPQSSFDLITAYSMFPHLKDQQGAIQRCALWLKSGGRLAICHSKSRRAINRHHQALFGEGGQDVLPPASRVQEYCVAAGLEPVRAVDDQEMFVVISQKP